MAQNGDGSDGTAQRALRRMAESDPELAARLIRHSLPEAAAKLREGMS
jgi:flagellar biosynthesis/type III secretory pathway M-ring protein FliF/YscJ